MFINPPPFRRVVSPAKVRTLSPQPDPPAPPKVGDTVKVRGFRGIACTFLRYRQEAFVPDGSETDMGDPNGDWQDVPPRNWKNTEDLETRDDETRAVVVMVGDSVL